MKKTGERYWVYILRVRGGNYYTGYTNNLEKRMREHIRGNAKCKFTRAFHPEGIAQYWHIYDLKCSAMRVERFIKKQTRKEKMILVEHPSRLKKKFEDERGHATRIISASAKQRQKINILFAQ